MDCGEELLIVGEVSTSNGTDFVRLSIGNLIDQQPSCNGFYYT